MGPYTRIEGPEKLVIDGAATERVSSVETYLAWHLLQLEASGHVVKRWKARSPLQAVVEHGRWLVICHCKTGMLTSPGIRLACCVQCGAVYEDITFPDDYAAIEHVLLQRPLRENQSWAPPETIDDLISDNQAHASELEAFHQLHGGEF